MSRVGSEGVAGRRETTEKARRVYVSTTVAWNSGLMSDELSLTASGKGGDRHA